MGTVSVSLYMVEQAPVAGALPVTMPLAEMLPELRRLVPGVPEGEILLALSREISETNTTLLELGVQTGDLMIVSPPHHPQPTPRPISHPVYLNTMRATEAILEISDYASIQDFKDVWERYSQPRPTAPNLYFGRYLLDLSVSLAALEYAPGDLVSIIVHPTFIPPVLVLSVASGHYLPFRINQSPTFLGNANSASVPENQLMDVMRVLPRRKRHLLQGEFLELYLQNQAWYARPVVGGSIPVFLNGVRIFPHRPRRLVEGNVLTLGYTPNEPLLQLVASFEIEKK